jgi:uncharacterized Tic20 family protein
MLIFLLILVGVFVITDEAFLEIVLGPVLALCGFVFIFSLLL